MTIMARWSKDLFFLSLKMSSFLCSLPSDTGSLRLGQDKFGDDDDAGSTVGPTASSSVPLRPVYDGPLPTPPQKAFQPGSTPAHLTHRFMVRLALEEQTQHFPVWPVLTATLRLRCGTRWASYGATMTSRTTPLMWSSTTQLFTMPCTSPTRWVTPWLMFPRRPCCWPAPAQMSLQGKKKKNPCQHFNFSVLLCGYIFLFDSFSPSARFNASTSRRGTLTRSGWSTCPRARTQRLFVWARAGRRWPPTR